MSASKIIKILLFVFLLLVLVGGKIGHGLYKKIYAPNTTVNNPEGVFLYIPTGCDYAFVLAQLDSLKVLRNKKGFFWTAEKKGYPNLVKPGRYLIKNRMSNNELVDMLRIGAQAPIKLSFNNLRTLDQFAEKIAEKLEFDSKELIQFLNDKEFLERMGLRPETIKCIFIPNTYEFYWNVSVESFVSKMYREYNNFWDNKRTRKLEKLEMTREEVVTLASIVNEETKKNDEKERIAGVYINRIKIGMRLQADPTVIYAVGDFNIRRVLKKHYRIDSPYNTYKYAGLPPGPICFPEISSIDAVLNYEKHKYIYFCAKADFSGYHSFAKTLSQHNNNARAYQRELNRRRIYK